MSNAKLWLGGVLLAKAALIAKLLGKTGTAVKGTALVGTGALGLSDNVATSATRVLDAVPPGITVTDDALRGADEGIDVIGLGMDGVDLNTMVYDRYSQDTDRSPRSVTLPPGVRADMAACGEDVGCRALVGFRARQPVSGQN